MISTLAVTVGFFLRTLLTLKWNGWFRFFLICSFVGVSFVVVALSAYPATNFAEWVWLPIFFVILVGFFYLKEILEPVTDALFIALGCIAAYLFFLNTSIEVAGSSIYFMFFFLPIYLSVCMTLVSQSNLVTQSFGSVYTILFMILNVWVAYILVMTILPVLSNPLEIVLLSFAYFPVAMTIFALGNFIPSKSNSFDDIATHTQMLGNLFFDADTSRVILICIILSTIFSAVLHHNGYISLPLMAAIPLILASYRPRFIMN